MSTITGKRYYNQWLRAMENAPDIDSHFDGQQKIKYPTDDRVFYQRVVHDQSVEESGRRRGWCSLDNKEIVVEWMPEEGYWEPVYRTGLRGRQVLMSARSYKS